MIASIDLTTSRADQLGLRERLLGQRPDRPLDGFLRFVGLRLEFFSQQRIEFGDFDGSGFGLRRPAGISGQP